MHKMAPVGLALILEPSNRSHVCVLFTRELTSRKFSPELPYVSAKSLVAKYQRAQRQPLAVRCEAKRNLPLLALGQWRGLARTVGPGLEQPSVTRLRHTRI
jgi:hypothetical protein